MLRDRLDKLDRLKQNEEADEGQARRGRGKSRRDQSPPTFRSPALESAERGRADQRRLQQNGVASTPPRLAGTTLKKPRQTVKRMSSAASATPAREFAPHKTLPKRSKQSLFSGVASRGSAVRTAEPARLPVSVISEEEQKKLAALEMRLPRVAGKIDAWLLTIVLALLCVGLVMVYSASSFMSALQFGDAAAIFEKQMLWAVMGVIVMLVTMRIDYRVWRRFSLVGMAVALPLLVIVLRFGTSAYGASRWLGFGTFFSFQPSELIKLVLALYMADWLARKGHRVGTFRYGLAPFVLLVGLILGLVLLENDMGTAIIIAGFATTMFFTAGANIVQFLLAMAGGALIFATQAFRGYRWFRLMGFINPFRYVTSINLQLYQSLLALGSGGWFGVGLGQSRQKTGYLPFPYTDSIFAITGEELGFIGCALIIVLFMFLAFRGFRLARRTQDMYGALLATGITTWLVLQAMINVGASTDSIPYTGVPLPFISFGGSSLIIAMAAIGVLLNISRYIQTPQTSALKRTVTMTVKKRNTKAHNTKGERNKDIQ